MARYSNAHIRQLLHESDTAATADLKGDKLEQLVKYLFERVPGVSFFEKNVLDGPRAHELDVVFINDQRTSPLYFLDFAIITECKNTANRLSSDGVGWFVTKLRARGATKGILISLSGITGVADGVSNAHSEVLDALNAHGISVLLLDRQEVENLSNTDELVTQLQRKILRLTLMRRII